MPSPRELADRFHSDWLLVHPFDASNYGISGYDDRVPDASEAGEAAWRDRVEELLGEANAFDTSKMSEAGQSSRSHCRGVAESGPSPARTVADDCRGGSRADWHLSVGTRGRVMTAARRTQTRPASTAEARAYLDKAREFLRAAEDSLELGNRMAAAGTRCMPASARQTP
jgi:hypothetical protein